MSELRLFLCDIYLAGETSQEIAEQSFINKRNIPWFLAVVFQQGRLTYFKVTNNCINTILLFLVRLDTTKMDGESEAVPPDPSEDTQKKESVPLPSNVIQPSPPKSIPPHLLTPSKVVISVYQNYFFLPSIKLLSFRVLKLR